MSLRDVTAVLVTGYAEDKVPGADGASLLRDFSVEARVGRCIAPSELELPTTRVELEAPTLQVRLGQRQYVALLQWLQGFTESMMKVLETSQSSQGGSQGVSQTSSQVVSQAVSQAMSHAASRLVDQVLTGLAAEKDVVPYSADELYVLQHNRLLSLRAVFQGIRVLLLEERAEETEVPLAELVLGALCVDVAFDGICAEFLLADGGYNAMVSGAAMYRQVGSQAVGVERSIHPSCRSPTPT